MTGITIYIIGVLINCLLMYMVEAYYDLTKQKFEIDANIMRIVMALSFVGTPFIYIYYQNEIEWTWINLIRRK